MLLEFKIKNFLSFKDEQILSFEATNDKHLDDYYCIKIKPNLKVLKVGIVYGANASGKSNLLVALNGLIHDIILDTKERNENIEIIPFLFDKQTPNKQSEIELSFFINAKKYIYQLVADRNVIYKEKLVFYPKTQPAIIFKRIFDKKKNNYNLSIGSKIKLSAADKKNLIANTLNNMSIISALKKINISFEELENVYKWFDTYFMPSINYKTDLFNWTTKQIENSSNCKGLLIDLLGKADFGISDIEIKKETKELTEIELSTLTDLTFLSEQGKERLLKEKTLTKKGVFFKHQIQNKESLENYILPKELESVGTLRFYGLGGVLNKLVHKDRFVSIDEIESSLHPDLFNHFLKLFLVNSKNSQLLFTTHNINLLTEKDIIRKDAIWFTEKQEDGSTELFSLADFDIRNDLSFINAYKIGKFGAKPNLGDYFINA